MRRILDNTRFAPTSARGDGQEEHQAQRHGGRWGFPHEQAQLVGEGPIPDYTGPLAPAIGRRLTRLANRSETKLHIRALYLRARSPDTGAQLE